MISDRYKCIFVHIPKTAGQSIEHFFLNLHGLSWNDRAPLLLKYNPDPQKGPEKLAHLKSCEYVSCGHIDKEQFNSYFKFTFVRNPWPRLLSEYHYRDYSKSMSFKDFVLRGLPTESDYTDTYRHVMPQCDFLYDGNGKLLVDFVGRFEKLQEDFDFICSQLSISSGRLPYINSSKQERSIREKFKAFMFLKRRSKGFHYTDYYDQETKQLVENMYARDIEAFKYSFGE